MKRSTYRTGQLGVGAVLWLLVPVLLAGFLILVAPAILEWRKLHKATRLDATSLSGCSLLASEMNDLARINSRIDTVRTSMSWLVASWYAAFVCSAFPVCRPVFIFLNRTIPPQLQVLSGTGRMFMLQQDQKRHALPLRIYSELNWARNQNKIPGARPYRTPRVRFSRKVDSAVRTRTLEILKSVNGTARGVNYPRGLKYHADRSSPRIGLTISVGRRSDREFERLVSECRVAGRSLESARFKERLVR